MKLKGINNSSKKTIALIKNTFAELLEEKKEIYNITVTELVERANITRGAFYSHYDNIFDVAQEMENELQEIAFSNLKKMSSYDDINYYLDIIFDYLKTNEGLYRKLLKSNDPILFMNRLNHKLFNTIKEALPVSNKKIDISINFYTSGAGILLIKYFRDEVDFSLDEIKQYLKDAFVELFN